MISNQLKPGLKLGAAASIRRSRLAFAFYCVLSLTLTTAVDLSQHVAAQEINDGPLDNQIVFFSIPIGANSAPVYASPSADSYQTGSILKDKYVEVYFCNRDGYCAIRPPHGSFSWVNGKFVELESGVSGRIVSQSGKAIPSRVGGPSPATSSIVQIGLQNNQKVKIFDKVSLSDGSVWYKISPPAGEFRWIRVDSLVQDEAVRQLPPKLSTRSEYMARLAPRETRQVSAEERARPQSDELELTLPPLENESEPLGFDPSSNGNRPNASEAGLQSNVDVDSFVREIKRLESDARQALQKTPLSIEEIKILQLRAENLFDEAPSDKERFTVQATYDALKKAEKAAENNLSFQTRQTASSNVNAMPQTSGLNIPPRRQAQAANFPNQFRQSPNGALVNAPIQNVYPNGTTFRNPQSIGAPIQARPQHFAVPTFGNVPPQQTQTGVPFPTDVQWVQATDENGVAQTIAIDRNGNVVAPGQVIEQPNAKVGKPKLGTLPQGYASTNENSKSGSKKSNKQTFAFAFSKENSPFNTKSKAAKVSDGTIDNSNLSKLPSILPSAQVIVPPQDYNVVAQNHARQNANLVAKAQRKRQEKNVETPNGVNATESQLATTDSSQSHTETPKSSANRQRTGTLVFQAPQQPNETNPEQASSIVKATPNASKPAGVQSQNSTIAPASSNVQKSEKKSSKIRQTGSFTPITVRTKDGFDAKGALVAISKGEGSPQYALLEAKDAEFNVGAYVKAGRGVVLEKFVGKQVGVKGNVGTVEVDGKTYKLVVVNSIFPQ